MPKKEPENDFSFLEIDPLSLDLEWMQHPAKYMEAMEAATNLEKVRNEKKEAIDAVKAKLDQGYRASYKSEGAKFTEATIAADVVLDDDYKEAVNEFHEAQHEYNKAMNLVRAMDHKKKALENLVQLCLAGYYSAPKEPRDFSVVDKGSERQRQKINRSKSK